MSDAVPQLLAGCKDKDHNVRLVLGVWPGHPGASSTMKPSEQR